MTAALSLKERPTLLTRPAGSLVLRRRPVALCLLAAAAFAALLAAVVIRGPDGAPFPDPLTIGSFR